MKYNPQCFCLSCQATNNIGTSASSIHTDPPESVPESNKVFENLSDGQPIEMGILRDSAERIFAGKHINFLYLPENQVTKTRTFIIMLNERITFWFLKKNGEWKFDGWEMGNYKNSFVEDRL